MNNPTATTQSESSIAPAIRFRISEGRVWTDVEINGQNLPTVLGTVGMSYAELGDARGVITDEMLAACHDWLESEGYRVECTGDFYEMSSDES